MLPDVRAFGETNSDGGALGGGEVAVGGIVLAWSGVLIAFVLSTNAEVGSSTLSLTERAVGLRVLSRAWHRFLGFLVSSKQVSALCRANFAVTDG